MKLYVYGLCAAAFALSLFVPLPSEAVSLEVEARPQHAAVESLPILGLVKTRSRVDFRLRGKITKRRARWAKQMVTSSASILCASNVSWLTCAKQPKPGSGQT